MKKPDEHKITYVSRLKEGGVEVKFNYKNQHGEFEERGSDGRKSNMDPHEDLVGVMNKCKEIVARVFNLTDLNQGDSLQKWKEQLRIDTIHISGEGKAEGVIISATYRNDVKHKMALNTSRMLIEGKAYGVEDEVQTILQELREETDAWLFDGKCGPHMFNQPEGKEEESESVTESQEETTS